MITNDEFFIHSQLFIIELTTLNRLYIDVFLAYLLNITYTPRNEINNSHRPFSDDDDDNAAVDIRLCACTKYAHCTFAQRYNVNV